MGDAKCAFISERKIEDILCENFDEETMRRMKPLFVLMSIREESTLLYQQISFGRFC